MVKRSTFSEDGLARVGSVEILDLPLSEFQASIETEFSEDESGFIFMQFIIFLLYCTNIVPLILTLNFEFLDNWLSSLVRRIVSQLDQLKRWIIKTINSIFNVGIKYAECVLLKWCYQAFLWGCLHQLADVLKFMKNRVSAYRLTIIFTGFSFKIW